MPVFVSSLPMHLRLSGNTLKKRKNHLGKVWPTHMAEQTGPIESSYHFIAGKKKKILVLLVLHLKDNVNVWYQCICCQQLYSNNVQPGNCELAQKIKFVLFLLFFSRIEYFSFPNLSWKSLNISFPTRGIQHSRILKLYALFP